MTIFRWNHDLETGVALLDQQHYEIFERANNFFLGLKCGDTSRSTRECLSFLQQYVLYHFQTEEAFQVQSGYPDYAKHQAQHLALVAKVKFFSVRIEESEYAPAVLEEFRAFLYEWINDHILTSDSTFTEYYKAQEGSILNNNKKS